MITHNVEADRIIINLVSCSPLYNDVKIFLSTMTTAHFSSGSIHLLYKVTGFIFQEINWIISISPKHGKSTIQSLRLRSILMKLEDFCTTWMLIVLLYILPDLPSLARIPPLNPHSSAELRIISDSYTCKELAEILDMGITPVNVLK
ncbi:hypothetical protein MC885_014807 [Smutsia gigantea]|nr:hypothetical protein MC885_014807 [Smutsia gigantea]